MLNPSTEQVGPVVLIAGTAGVGEIKTVAVFTKLISHVPNSISLKVITTSAEAPVIVITPLPEASKVTNWIGLLLIV